MKTRTFLLICLGLCVSSIAIAQQTLPPFVSRIATTVEGASVRITWKDSADEVDHYILYRSDEEIVAENFAAATIIGEVESGQMAFTDSPPDDTPYYYLILAADENGEGRQVFFPFRNKTTTPVSVDAEVIAATRPVTVTGIHARVIGNQIALTYDTSGTKRNISIYRGTQPIVNTRELLRAIPIATISSATTEYYDEPVPGLDYFYAVFDTESLRAGHYEFNAGANVLTAAAKIPSTLASNTSGSQASVRSRPLPYLLLSSKLDTGTQLRSASNYLDIPEVPLSPAVIKAIDEMVPRDDDLFARKSDPEILPEDRAADPALELPQIVKEVFSTKSWSEGIERFESFIQSSRSSSAITRARFYIGQAYYFESDYRQAFIYFLYASDGYYAQAKPWMDNVLHLLRAESLDS